MKIFKKRLINKRGFTPEQFVIGMILLAVMSAVAWGGSLIYIKNAKLTVVRSDLLKFETAIKTTLMENPQLAKVPQKYQDALVYEKLDYYFEEDMKVDLLHSGTEDNVTRGGSSYIDFSLLESENADEAGVVSLYREDPYKTKYKIFVNPVNLDITGDGVTEATSTDSEIRIFVVSNGENQQTSNTPYKIESRDDVVLMVEVVNGSLRVGYYGIKDVSENNKILWRDSNSLQASDLNPKKDKELDLRYAHMPVLK